MDRKREITLRHDPILNNLYMICKKYSELRCADPENNALPTLADTIIRLINRAKERGEDFPDVDGCLTHGVGIVKFFDDLDEVVDETLTIIQGRMSKRYA